MPRHGPRRLFGAGIFLAAALAASSALAADPYPSKPIHIVVPYAAGGTTDQVARALQQPMSEVLGQTIVIDNKPGAGGTLGTDYVVRADPDGYTLVFGNTGPNAIVQLMRKVPYDPLTDLRPISVAALAPLFLAVPTDSPVKNVKELIALARQQQDKFNFGSVGNGSLSHLTGEYFNELAGTKMLHVPYNGGAPMMTAFVGGQIQAAFVTGLDGATLLRAGKVRYIAVGAPKRSELLLNVPTVAEDVPGFKSISWFGLLAPKGVPDDVIAKLHAAVEKAVARPEVQKLFAERNVEAKASTPDELMHIIKDEVAQWGPIVKKANIQM